jgi:hypothetical protein
MLKDAEGTEKRSERAFTGAFAMLVVTLACSIVVVLAPRPVQPSQLPSLRLPRDRVQSELLRDRELRARARSFVREPDVVRVLSLYGDEGRAELANNLDMALLANNRQELSSSGDRLFTRLGVERTRALMAWLTERALSALAKGADDQEARGLLGGFPSLLVRLGYVHGPEAAHPKPAVQTVHAAPRVLVDAPELAVRTLYKARFNLIFERALDRDLTPTEQMAYEGFNALHASGMEPERRARAAQAFFRVGGHDGAEVAAIWMFQGGAHEPALSLLRSEYARTGALRLRNMALYVARLE